MMLWLGIALCLCVSFVFSGIEAGILSVNRVRLRHRVKLRDPAAIRLNRLLKEPDRLLMTVIIVTNLMNIFAIAMTTAVFVRSWGRAGYILSLVFFVPLYFFGLELFPKSLFRRFPYRALVMLSEPLRIADLLLSPVLAFGVGLARRMAREDQDSRKLFAGREEFKYFTAESERSGVLSSVERQLINNVVDFQAITARDLMQPLSDFHTIRYDSEVEELIAASHGGSVERFLVVADSGEILGLVELFEAILDRAPRSRVSSFLRRITPVPPTEPAPRLLRNLRTARTPVALVVEGGEPLGIVFSEAVYKRLISPA